jgi:hypothetical protein
LLSLGNYQQFQVPLAVRSTYGEFELLDRAAWESLLEIRGPEGVYDSPFGTDDVAAGEATSAFEVLQASHWYCGFSGSTLPLEAHQDPSLYVVPVLPKLFGGGTAIAGSLIAARPELAELWMQGAFTANARFEIIANLSAVGEQRWSLAKRLVVPSGRHSPNLSALRLHAERVFGLPDWT